MKKILSLGLLLCCALCSLNLQAKSEETLDHIVAIVNDDVAGIHRQFCELIQTGCVEPLRSPTNWNCAQWRSLRFDEHSRQIRPTRAKGFASLNLRALTAREPAATLHRTGLRS